MRKRLSLAAAVLGAVLLSACGSIKIGRIVADPTRYRNRQVSVTGTVVTGVGVLGKGGYQIEDETGRLYVISTTGIPSRGSRVTVTGTVHSGANVLGTNLGTAIRENHHRVH